LPRQLFGVKDPRAAGTGFAAACLHMTDEGRSPFFLRKLCKT
jgi:hypothetical protein